ncbi:hypothetical protein Dimus_023649 [Dionaea muscipula]
MVMAPEVIEPKRETAASFHWIGAADDGKTKRHPRWTREETLVLIKGKDLVENGDRKGHRFCSAFRSDHAEPKWDMISSYCRQHGVSRGPAQCRKRWSNLTADFRKIRTWESQLKDGDHQTEPFWTMRNNSRKDRKLPTFFDRHVYDVLDGKAVAAQPISLAPVRVTDDDGNSYEGDMEEEEEGEEEDQEEEDAEAAFDNSGRGRDGKAENDLFSDLPHSGKQEARQRNEKERFANRTNTETTSTPPLPSYSDAAGMSSIRWKKQRLSTNCCCEKEKDDMKEEIMKVLDANSKMLKTQLDLHNNNSQWDREQRKEDTKSLVAVVTKLTEALGKIADKL